MANNNAKDILQAIYNTLTASPSLINSTTLAQIVIGTNVDTSVGFPFCRIYLADFSSPSFDTVSYKREYSFIVEVRQEATNKTKSNAELDFANAVDAVLNRLNGTWQLGIGVENTEVSTSPVQSVLDNGAAVRVAQIRVTVTTLVQNPS